MPFIAIVYVPDHTAVEPPELVQYMEADLQGSGCQVVGLFRWPNRKELTCRGSCGGKLGNYVRDAFGFMKCGVCGKRNRKLRSWFIGGLFDKFGANLVSRPVAAFRTPEGYGPSNADND